MQKKDIYFLFFWSVMISLLVCVQLFPDKPKNIPRSYVYKTGWHIVQSRFGMVPRIRSKSGWLYATGGKSRFTYVEDQ